MTPTDFAVDALAAYRLTRLVTTDTITAPLRERARWWSTTGSPAVQPLPGETSPRPWVEELLGCSWCIGVWAAFAVRVLPRWVRRSLACAAAAGILAQHYDD